MRQIFRKAATSLLLIVLVALGARLAFAWNETRKMPSEVLRTVALSDGNRAYRLLAGGRKRILFAV